jgi:hypothetical protein
MGMDCLFVLMFSTLFLGLLVFGGNEVEIATFLFEIGELITSAT